MIEVKKICKDGEIYRLEVILPDLSADPLSYNITRDPKHDKEPVYQELCQRLNAGEFDDMIEPCPDLAQTQTIKEIRAAAMQQLATAIRETEDRILGRVPRQMRIDFAAGIERSKKQATVTESLEAAVAQLGDLTVADAE